MLGLLAS